MEAARHLYPVPDPQTGEIQCTHSYDCPQCAEKLDAYDVLEKKHRGALAEISRLKNDREVQAREHRLWTEAQAVFDWWRLACWHPKSQFKADTFYEVKPRLEEVGAVGVLKAVCGLAFDPTETRMKNGKMKKFDSWELMCRSQWKCEDFAERVPYGEDSERWKSWLVQKIESNFW